MGTQTLTARVYVLTIENQLGHMTRKEPLHVSLHVEGAAATLGPVATRLSKMALYEMLVETTPQIVAFDMSSDGQVEMRGATSAETLAFAPPTSPSVSRALQAAISKGLSQSVRGATNILMEQVPHLAAA